jgi:drug/metabolite transporter (DMT)-like permease
MTTKQGEPNYGTIQKTTNIHETPSVDTNKHEKHSIVGILLIMLGAFSFSIMFFLVKLMSSTNTFTLVFYRSIVQILISYITLVSRGESPFGPKGVRWLLSIRGIFGAGAVCSWFFGIQVLPLPDAVTLQFTTPPFAAAFAVCMVGEVWKPLDMIGAVVCFAGVFFIAHSSESGADDSSAASIFLKASAVMVTTGGAALAGIAYVCVRKIGDRASAVVMVLYYGVFSIPMVIIGSGLLLNKWDVWSDPDLTARDYCIMLVMGLGGYGGQFFTNLGLQRETAATVGGCPFA